MTLKTHDPDARDQHQSETRSPYVPSGEPSKPEAPSIQSIANKAMSKAKGDVLKAAIVMEKMVRADKSLYARLMDPLVRTACYDAVSSACRKNRSVIYHTAQPSADTERARIGALSRATASSLMKFPLPGGKYLGDATAGEVQDAHHFYSTQAVDMTAKAAWLAAIAKRVPEGKTVKQALTDKDLFELREKSHD